jgi:hypothetical protein
MEQPGSPSVSLLNQHRTSVQWRSLRKTHQQELRGLAEGEFVGRKAAVAVEILRRRSEERRRMGGIAAAPLL